MAAITATKRVQVPPPFPGGKAQWAAAAERSQTVPQQGLRVPRRYGRAIRGTGGIWTATVTGLGASNRGQPRQMSQLPFISFALSAGVSASASMSES